MLALLPLPFCLALPAFSIAFLAGPGVLQQLQEQTFATTSIACILISCLSTADNVVEMILLHIGLRMRMAVFRGLRMQQTGEAISSGASITK